MRRGITRRATEDIIGTIRERVPGIALRTTLITGFPAETEQEFENLEDFVRTMQFDRLGVFTYSQEDGTTAFPMGDPVPQEEKVRRQQRLYDVQEDVAAEKREARLGTMERILIERREGGYYYGRSRFDAPEVDHCIRVESGTTLPIGDFVNARITAIAELEEEHELEASAV
jgi:ribosomal protein S12 methylthiotransferase